MVAVIFSEKLVSIHQTAGRHFPDASKLLNYGLVKILSH
jgi:hypothetical protein